MHLILLSEEEESQVPPFWQLHLTNWHFLSSSLALSGHWHETLPPGRLKHI
jgi:hypothetical protein